MATRIRTLNFLPEIFKTPSNAQFLAASLDQIVSQPETRKIEGYIGSKFGYGINAKDYYVTEPTKTRKDYQLDPGVVFTKTNESVAQDFISYPGIIDALKVEGGVTNNNDRMFTSEFYSWDSFTNLDKIINFNQYYWIPEGPERVVVSAETVFSSNDYIVYDVVNGYNIVPITAAESQGTTNPTLTLLRGGTYSFAVNQDGQFWIQGQPGVTGFSPTQPNLQTRDVLGVDNNGASEGIVTFTVPQKDAQNQYNFPGNNLADVVCTFPFSAINGKPLSEVVNIDGVTALQGLRVMFYNTGEPYEIGYVSNFYDYTAYDYNNDLNAIQTISVTATNASGNLITCNSTANLVVGNSITFSGVTEFGGIQNYSETAPDTLYYVESITSPTQFSISLKPYGSQVPLSTASGSMTGYTNQGQFEEGFYTNVSENFYTITYVGDPSNPVIRLIPNGEIPVNEKITAVYGTQWISRSFYRNDAGAIVLIPYISAPLDTLYYQDSLSADKVGIIRLIESNTLNTIDVERDILGQTQYTSTNGIVFTNGLKVSFQGSITPLSYKTGEYYVEGVGTSIELLPVQNLIAPESFTSTSYVPWDTSPWGMSAWEGNSYIPITPDYITIARNSIDRNSWSRSNRWFHIDVINATAQYNNNPELITIYATSEYKAKRPIIEFYPNIRLFNSGAEGKDPVDFIDLRTTDAFSLVAGQENYYPDVEVYTSYNASITSTNYTPARTVTAASSITKIFTCNSTTGFRVGDSIIFNSVPTIGGTVTGTTYFVYEVVSPTEFKLATTKYGDLFSPTTGSGSCTLVWAPQSTLVTVLADDVVGAFTVGQYVSDSANKLPTNTQILSISGTTTLTLEVGWDIGDTGYIPTTSAVQLIGTDTTNDNYALFDGSTVVFAADTNENVKNKIYVSRFSSVTGSSTPVITLTEVEDGLVLPDQQTVALRGYYNQGKEFYFDGLDWIEAQQKITVNQPPFFDVFDENNISFGNSDVYVGTSFIGCKLFAYGVGSGLDDSILGFPIRYSAVDNVGDISFDVSLNVDTFDYVSGTTPITQLVNTGYVFQYRTREDRVRQIGWQTAVSPSVQYQIFEFDYDVLVPTNNYRCDISMLPAGNTNWPTIAVYINNVRQPASSYTVTVEPNTTVVTLTSLPNINTVIQIQLLSNQVSQTAYYQIPVNLNNNPLNADLTTANIGDIRGQYQSIFYNNPNTTGNVFGPNNFRDLGNLVPWGNRIIQNSASLALPGAFLRKQEHNLFNALLFNSREYIKFKNLLVNTVENADYTQIYNPSVLLDDAMDQITASKTDSQPFFWSDMLPSKAAYITNVYSFANSLDVSIYPLSRIYDFATANYYGVLVYLTRTTNGVTTFAQLIKGQDYTISDTTPSLTVTLDLLPGDSITIKEYTQTYGSYVPNTPTKLGLYPAYVPTVILDSDYTTPTYFIKGHDGSYNRLYGEYDPISGVLTDFRDQVLLEFEQRIYNNLKLSAVIPIQAYEIVPGFFRDIDYSNEEWLMMYTPAFLNWIGQNRLNYKKQLFNTNDNFTYNYFQSGNAINNEPIFQGYWRGIYQFFYDTTTPNTTPWEMLGFTEQPTWWTSRYGPAPYTSDNLVLWNDLAEGIDWNNGNPITISNAARPGLLDVIPVDSAGNLLSPLDCVVGNFNQNLFQRDWKVGDDAPVEFSYRRSSSYPFDLIRLMALMKPAEFFNLAVDVDHYKYNAEFNQYLLNNRSHLKLTDIDVYGSGTPVTSYINWIVDYEKQAGVAATENIKTLLANMDVRLVYRLAGFSDKTLLKFYVEKGTPNSRNASLLIPDESYAVLLYDNQPFNRIVYSSVVIQIVEGGFSVFGNSQTSAYFKTLKPKYAGNFTNIEVENLKVKVTVDHYNQEQIVPYGTIMYTVQEVAQFLNDYAAYLVDAGMVFDVQDNDLEINWNQMTAEFLYWAQTGWSTGSVVTLNPAARTLKINKDSNIVQPLTIQQTNFILNQNLYPVQSKDLAIIREGTAFTATALNDGDTLSYGQFNVSNFEHGIVFNNVTLFGDIIYNLTTGLRQTRISVRGTKSAAWDGTVDVSGFIYNQDNIKEWNRTTKYTKGEIVKYKNKYWTALKIIQASELFNEEDWKRTDYDEIQKGLLPNSSTRSYESTLYYDINQANLENDADLLSFSLIGYRPRDYLALADLTDITQVNVYRNLIKSKGTLNAASAFKGARLPQGGIDYDIYENWAIKSGEFGGVLNSNFIEFKVNQNYMTGNPAIVGLTNGLYNNGVQQEVPIYSLFNYGRPISDVNVLPTVNSSTPTLVFPDAGYVNYNDVKMSAFFYAQLPLGVNQNGVVIPIQNFYVRDYVWLANYLEKWEVFTPVAIGQVLSAKNNLNDTVTITFNNPHNLVQYQPFSIVNLDPSIDGYYLVTIVIDQYKVLISKTLDPSIKLIQGQGVGMKFTSQRVDTPADIDTLPLLDSEFIKNTVWVDTDTSGSWGVYRKSINYQYQRKFTKTSTQSYGSAVATGQQLGYLIGDADAGYVYRYTYNDLTDSYQLAQTLSSGTSFGATIAHAGDLYAISEPTGTPKVHIYKLNNTIASDDLVVYQTAIAAQGGSTNWGSAVAMSGDQSWLYISAIDLNRVYVYRKSQLTGEFEYSTYLTIGGLVSGDNFGYSIGVDYYGDCVVIGAPNQDYSATVDNWGYAYVFDRTVQNIEIQYSSISPATQTLQLAWSPAVTTVTATATNAVGDYITLSSVSGISVDDPIMFTGSGLAGTEIIANKVYYVNSIVGSTVSIKETRDSVTPIAINTVASISVPTYVQTTPIFVSRNGTLVTDNNYAVVSNTLVYTGSLNAGDIITVSSNNFTLAQTLTTGETPQVGSQFGISVSTTTHASEVIVGAPFQLNSQFEEGAVYRFTDAGAKYGTITGTTDCNVTTIRTMLINGYLVYLPAGDATTVANAINSANITNISASNLDGKLVLSLTDTELAQVNEKLVLGVLDTSTLGELGIEIYVNTQKIHCPHRQGPTQFGTLVKFNEFDSFVASAPVGTRYAATTFDFSDDENQDDDTLFDNNATQWIDQYPNAGAVYMFDYVSQYDENLLNTGKFVYAQSVNAQNLVYSNQPRYGTSIDFDQYSVIIGTPNDYGSTTGTELAGQVITYANSTGVKDWSLYRYSAPVVDTNRIFNIQLFSAETNNTLINLDYIDPLQGKILGAARQNIDIVSNDDPAQYNNSGVVQGGIVWGAAQLGQIWLNTRNMRYVNYHQSDDVSYNSQYWATLFPGSDVAVYSWVASNVPPTAYQGPGTPYDTTVYSIQYIINAAGALTPIYYFWARNTNLIFADSGKTLADSIIASYIENPKGSGVSYFTPLLPSVYGLYNSGDYFNANDSVLHIGYATGSNDDPSHQQYNLIRDGYASDFLPGIPTTLYTLDHTSSTHTGAVESSDPPVSLYNRLLDSLSGVDDSGQVVPNPYLPKAVQSGILARPRQSFFYNRFTALKNYLQYANTVLAQYPITEIRQASFLTASGDFYDTADYWEFVNWWAPGYDNNTKSALQVSIYADLSTLSVPSGTIVTVSANDTGRAETYILEITGNWRRIGLQRGTIAFKSALWDYSSVRLGFGDNFFDTDIYDVYPSEETKKIIRALNEQIYTQDLLIYRNKSLILLFEYIQSETSENQNYLPWLNKTSFIDVSHTIRELRPIEVFQSDNQDFLSGYLNEIKPYHVVIKEFLFKYTGTAVFEGDITDFDLPSKYSAATKQFITPELVYQNANNVNTFLPENPIWQQPEYSQWYQNYGVSLTGQSDVQIATLQSYISLNSNEFSVDNAQGFPINGIVQIGEEQIGYASVDRSLNVLSGLTRGVNGTSISTHVPNTLIYIDLPAVLVLDGGRAYSDPPKVTAYIDPILYPAPVRPAVLTAVMNLDSVLRIDVEDPGQGYAVLPKIVIDPAVVINFESTQVNTTFNTIQLFAPLLQTGDLIQYKVSSGTSVGGLEDNQWYYINVLETVPSVVVGLYANYTDSVNDHDRITLYSTGTGTHKLNVGARASAISSAIPVRENNIVLRFDRTTYNSDIVEWVAGRYYGAFYAGTYSNSESVASSSISLESSQPPINSILASAQGVAFEIVDVRNDRTVTYSSFIRTVTSTIDANDCIRLNLQDDGSGNPNASGGTLGFYIGMPVKFKGEVGTSGLVNEAVYYVHSILNQTDFTVSQNSTGSPIQALSSYTIGPAGLECYVGEVTDAAVITVNYPGIMNVTATQAVTNKLTVPLNLTGSGGTAGFYINLPIFFTGSDNTLPNNGVFGGVIENQVYYITTVVDSQTFTMSEKQNPLTYNILEVVGVTPAVGQYQYTLIVDADTNQMSVNDPIIINTMVEAGVSGTTFGGLTSGTTYYVSAITSSNSLRVSATINGPVISLTSVSPAANTSALLTSQVDTVILSTATGNNMVMNVSLPVSPGQVNGQRFTLYNTSGQYPGITGTDTTLISRDIAALIGQRTIDTVVVNVYRIIITNIYLALTDIYVNMPVEVSTSIGSLVSGTTYYVVDSGIVEIEATYTSSSTNAITCDTTESLFIDMPIVFSGSSIGGLIIDLEYFVKEIIDDHRFTVSASPGGTVVTVTTASGLMIGTGLPYIQVCSSTPGGSAINPGNTQQNVSSFGAGTPGTVTVAAAPANLTKVEFRKTTGSTLPTGISENVPYYVRNKVGNTFNISLTTTGSLITLVGTGSGTNVMIVTSSVTVDQTPLSTPVFDVSYILGGYRVIITNGASGYAVDNVITINGANIGGTTPLNNLTLTVNSISSTGEILDVICNGLVPGEANQYYLKVISPTEFALYENQLLTVAVSGLTLPYIGISQTTVTETQASTDIITVSSTSEFSVNDAVVFTGNITGGMTVGQTYYIIDNVNFTATTLQVSDMPGGSPISLTTALAPQSYTMAKAGSYALLPEPFIFNQSIVKYNNRVYVCVVSNNDTEFIFGKWELLTSGDRRLNAMDRVLGYYQPTDNMPGVDLTQLFEGVTYPNSTYLGNAFAPAQQFALDTILQDQPFYPTEVDINSVLWNGVTYLAAADTPTYSSVIGSTDANQWEIDKLANTNLSTTDIIYEGGYYILTTNNAATPLFRSQDGITWTTNGYYTPYGSVPYDITSYDFTALSVSSLYLNAVSYLNNTWVAVGENIVSSDDTYIWRQRFAFTNPDLTNILYGVKGVDMTLYTGFVVVGKGQEIDYSSGIGVTVNVNLLFISSDGINWGQIPFISSKGFYGVTNSSTTIVAVGEDGAIFNSTDGGNWYAVNDVYISGVNDVADQLNLGNIVGFSVNDPVRFTSSFNNLSSGTTYYIKTISGNNVQLSLTAGGAVIALSAAQPSERTYMYAYPRTLTLRDVHFANNRFIAVGDSGIVRRSTNGTSWATMTSGTTENLNGITFNADDSTWIAVGDNNTILVSSDNGTTWTESSVFAPQATVYDVQGAEFEFGYGPEELVPGVVTDTMTMTVATRPGTDWDAAVYAHVGYNVVSREYTPTSGTQVNYDFSYVAENPISLAVYVINGTTGLATAVYEPTYSVDWINNVLTLASPLTFLPVSDRLRIDVYEVGNGNQLVKASTKTDPIRINTTTGWNEIEVNCNYAATIYNGSGVIRPNSQPKDTIATETDSANNSILCENVDDFVVNSPITFQGSTFGGILEDTTYYVKTVSQVSKRITISQTYNVSTGTAGPTMALSDGTGSMYVIIQIGTGAVWTDPIVYHNGNKMILGSTGTITRTNSSTNSITCNTTGALVVGTPITFSNTIFGGVIQPQVAYNIFSIVDGNEFTIEDPNNLGNELQLTNATGGASFVSNDYAFGIASNGISAKIVFAVGTYDSSVDYISYTLFGETLPVQYGYTLPETQQWTYAGSSVFSMTNYNGGSNPTNAIVEVNGLRLTNTAYTISDGADTLTITSALTNGDKVAVTTFNLTDRQYLNTQYGITGKTVSTISNITNNITPYAAIVNVTATNAVSDKLTCSSVTNLAVGQTIIFKGTAIANVNVSGQVYYIKTISGLDITISESYGGATFDITSTASGLMIAYVGGQPAVRVTTTSAHNLVINDLVRIDGTQGSVQLNNNTYYVHIISTTQFDLYSQPYVATYGAVNYPITDISAYTTGSGGYVWKDGSFTLIDTYVTATSTDPILGNRLTVSSTDILAVGTPIIFTGTVIGGVVADTTYYIREILSSTQFTITDTRDGDEFVLTAATGSMQATQWEQDNVDRLWVTINGYRVPSSSLRLNLGNELSILVGISSSDTIIITSMMPSATPNELVYLVNVNQLSEGVAYRANTQTRTWLTQPLSNTDDIIYVNDVTRLTDSIVQTEITPAAVDNVYSIGLTADKRMISNVTVYNNTKSAFLDSNDFSVVIENLSPILKITAGSYIAAGDSLTIYILEGNLLYMNGEQIKFGSVDLLNNTISQLQRGANGTGIQTYYPLYTEVFGILSSNEVTSVEYSETWNSNIFNAVDGDPLQISETAPAIFLNSDVN